MLHKGEDEMLVGSRGPRTGAWLLTVSSALARWPV